jgi:hypothetical protein
LYLQFEQAEDPIGLISDALYDEFNVQIERKEIVTQLIAKGIISDSDVCRFEHMLGNAIPTRRPLTPVPEVVIEARDEIGAIVKELCKTNMRQQVIWVHNFLLTVATVRSHGANACAAHAIPFNSMGKQYFHLATTSHN